MEKVVKEFLTQLGYDGLLDEEQEKRIDKWLKWYKGKTKEHNYTIYTGKKVVKRTLKSLNIISQSCNDMSDFYFNEKLDITIDNKKIQKIINECLEQNNFLENGNKLLNLVKALGTGAFVPYLDNNVLKINYINATGIVILKKTNDGVENVLFYSKKRIKNGIEITINCHVLKDEGYIIYNRKYFSKDGSNYTEEEIDKKLKEIHTYSTLPNFAMLFTPDVNNEDIDSPYGISSYANALDIVISLDRAYDSLDNEVALGKKRVYVPSNGVQFNVDPSAGAVPAFDPNDVAFYAYPGKDTDKLVESSFDLRIEELTNALQTQLNLYTSKVGLGQNFYKFKDGQTYVNTDNVMSTNSDLFRKIKKQENIITRALNDLIYAIASLIGIKEKFEISVFYDDSIIEDTEKVRQQAQAEYSSRLISKAQYYRDVYKLKDNEALKFAKQMNKEILEQTITDGEDFDEE